MTYLVDTYALIWFLEGDDALSETAKKLMLAKNNQLFVS